MTTKVGSLCFVVVVRKEGGDGGVVVVNDEDLSDNIDPR